MKKTLLIVLTLLVLSSAGCWMSGPWTSSDTVRSDFEDKVQIGMLQRDLEDILGKPSEVHYALDADGRPISGSQAAWLLFKYDYPTDPLLIGVRVDYFGVVVEKRLDDLASAAAKAGEAEGRFDYPGAPMERFREMERRERYGGGR